MPNSQKIILAFDSPIEGDATGKEGIPWGYKAVKTTNFTRSASDSNAGAVANAFDNSESTYWGTSTALPNWVRMNFNGKVNRLRVYIGGSNRPRAFQFQGSNDLSVWTDIVASEFPNATQWNTYNFNVVEYMFYRILVTSRWSTSTWIYEIELYEAVVIGNEQAFTVSGIEKDPLVVGNLAPKTYGVIDVKRKEIELNFNQNNLWNIGEFTDTQIVNNKLQLEYVNPVIDPQTQEIITPGYYKNSGEWVAYPLDLETIGMVLDNELDWTGENLTSLVNNEVIQNVSVQTAITTTEFIQGQIGIGDGTNRYFYLNSFPDEKQNDFIFINTYIFSFWL